MHVIVDEGHRLKNAGCKLNTELRCITSTHRLLLTGTPLQNDLSELWSLLNFLLPDLFGSSADFQTWWGPRAWLGRASSAPREGVAAVIFPPQKSTHPGSPRRFGQGDVERVGRGGAGQGAHAAATPGCPAMPADAQAMAQESGELLTEEQQLIVTTRLHQVLRPFVLRRMKESLELPLPDKASAGFGRRNWRELRAIIALGACVCLGRGGSVAGLRGACAAAPEHAPPTPQTPEPRAAGLGRPHYFLPPHRKKC